MQIGEAVSKRQVYQFHTRAHHHSIASLSRLVCAAPKKSVLCDTSAAEGPSVTTAKHH